MMKYIIHTLTILFFFSLLVLVCFDSTASETTHRGKLSITEIRMQIVGDSIELSFHCVPEQFVLKGKERIVVIPMISDGINQSQFLPFVIVGKKGKMSFLWSSDYRNGMKIVKHKQEFVYREKMKYEKWMKGGLVKSCTKQAKLITVPVCGRILQNPAPEELEFIRKENQLLGFIKKSGLRTIFMEADERLKKDFYNHYKTT